MTVNTKDKDPIFNEMGEKLNKILLKILIEQKMSKIRTIGETFDILQKKIILRMAIKYDRRDYEFNNDIHNEDIVDDNIVKN